MDREAVFPGGDKIQHTDIATYKLNWPRDQFSEKGILSLAILGIQSSIISLHLTVFQHFAMPLTNSAF